MLSGTAPKFNVKWLQQTNNSIIRSDGDIMLTAYNVSPLDLSSDAKSIIRNQSSFIISTAGRIHFLHGATAIFASINNVDGGLLSAKSGIDFPKSIILNNMYGSIESQQDLTIPRLDLNNEHGRFNAKGKLYVNLLDARLTRYLMGSFEAPEISLDINANTAIKGMDKFLSRQGFDIFTSKLNILAPNAIVQICQSVIIPYSINIACARFSNAATMYIDGDLTVNADLILNEPEPIDNHFSYGYQDQDNFQNDLTIGQETHGLLFEELILTDASKSINAAVIRSKGKMILKTTSSSISNIKLANREFEPGTIDTRLGGLITESDDLEIYGKKLVIGLPSHETKEINLSHIDSGLHSFKLSFYSPNLSYISSGGKLILSGTAAQKLTLINTMGIIKSVKEILLDETHLFLNYGGQVLAGDGTNILKSDKFFNIAGTLKYDSGRDTFIEYTVTPSSFINAVGTINIISPDVRNAGSYIHAASGLNIQGGQINGEITEYTGSLLNDALALVFNQKVWRCSINRYNSSKRFAGVRYGSESKVTHDWQEHTVEAVHTVVGAALTSDIKVSLEFNKVIQKGVIYAPDVSIVTSHDADFGSLKHIRYGASFEMPTSIRPTDSEIISFNERLQSHLIQDATLFDYPLIVLENPVLPLNEEVDWLFGANDYNRFIMRLLQTYAHTAFVKDLWKNKLYDTLKADSAVEIRADCLPILSSKLAPAHTAGIITANQGQITKAAYPGIYFEIREINQKKVLVPAIHLPTGSIHNSILRPEGATIGDAVLNLNVGGQLNILSSVIGGDVNLSASILVMETTTFREKVKLSGSLRYQGGGFGQSYRSNAEWWDEIVQFNEAATLAATSNLNVKIKKTATLKGAAVSVGGNLILEADGILIKPVIGSKSFDMPEGNAGGQSRGVCPVIGSSSVLVNGQATATSTTLTLTAANFVSEGCMTLTVPEKIQVADMGLPYTAENSRNQQRNGLFNSITNSTEVKTYEVQRSNLGSTGSSTSIMTKKYVNQGSTVSAGGGDLIIKADEVIQKPSLYRSTIHSSIVSSNLFQGSRSRQLMFYDTPNAPIAYVNNGNYIVETRYDIHDYSLQAYVNGDMHYTAGRDIYIAGTTYEWGYTSQTISWGISNPLLDFALTASEGSYKDAFKSFIGQLPIYRHKAMLLGADPNKLTGTLKAGIGIYNDALALASGYAQGGAGGMMESAASLMNLGTFTLSLSKSQSSRHVKGVISSIYHVRGSSSARAHHDLHLLDSAKMENSGSQSYNAGHDIIVRPAITHDVSSYRHESVSLSYNPFTSNISGAYHRDRAEESHTLYRPVYFTSEQDINFNANNRFDMMNPAIRVQGDVEMDARYIKLEFKLDEHLHYSSSFGINLASNSRTKERSIGLSGNRHKSKNYTLGERSEIQGTSVLLRASQPIQDLGVTIPEAALTIEAPGYVYTPLNPTSNTSEFSINSTFDIPSRERFALSLQQNITSLASGFTAAKLLQKAGGSAQSASAVGTLISSALYSRMPNASPASSGLSVGPEFSYTDANGTVSSTAFGFDFTQMRHETDVFQAAYDHLTVGSPTASPTYIDDMNDDSEDDYGYQWGDPEQDPYSYSDETEEELLNESTQQRAIDRKKTATNVSKSTEDDLKAILYSLSDIENDDNPAAARQQAKVDAMRADADTLTGDGMAKDHRAAQQRDARARASEDEYKFNPDGTKLYASELPTEAHARVIPGMVADTPVDAMRALMADPDTTRAVADPRSDAHDLRERAGNPWHIGRRDREMMHAAQSERGRTVNTLAKAYEGSLVQRGVNASSEVLGSVVGTATKGIVLALSGVETVDEMVTLSRVYDETTGPIEALGQGLHAGAKAGFSFLGATEHSADVLQMQPYEVLQSCVLDVWLHLRFRVF